ncbi:MAG: threonine synthase [Syntrophomonadaceae bacterium]|nr:threonine synthase [Syntrophomonadaceae bacterium]
MQYQSSRGQSGSVSAAQAIVKGIAPDGGLFLPDHIPQLTMEEIKSLAGLSYQGRAQYIMQQFLTDFSADDVRSCVEGAYNSRNFDHDKIAPLVQLEEGLYILELWHGPTSAFKDMALQILPHFLTVSLTKTGDDNEIVILVATSGDTGKAALEGFRDVPGTRILVFFPQKGVSQVQKLQMMTQEGNNVYVAAVEGNFDDAQNGVKNIFASDEAANALGQRNMKLSSANSINWGRLLPQIVYYISAYADLLAEGSLLPGQKINIVVPTGNFGNILAAYYAGRMGVPINKLICASNANNVLTDFIKTGIYNRNRSFEKTISPSMDILISSNLERLLYEVTNHDSEKVSGWMQELKDQGCYSIDEASRNMITDLFWADYSSDEETIARISRTWQQYSYLLDTHTAVAVDVYEKYHQVTGDNTMTIIASTASPFKFGASVARAVMDMPDKAGEFELLRKLEEKTGWEIPNGIRSLEEMVVRHNTITNVADMQDTMLTLLK